MARYEVCPRCKTTLDKDSNKSSCVWCGYIFKKPAVCPKCGKEGYSREHKYCPHCGTGQIFI